MLAHLRHLELRGLSRGTVEARRRALTRLTAQLPVPLLQATAADLLRWRTALDVAPDTIGSYVSHAHQFYVWAVTQGLVRLDPAEAIPVPASVRRLPRPIDDRELFAALAGSPDRIRPWLVLAAWAGFRAKEIALLRRECVLDCARPPVLIVASDATKGHRERVVPLTAFVAAELYTAGLPGRGWVFRRQDGLPGPNDPANVSKLSNAYLHECGISATLHQLRHWFGTMTYRACRDLRTVQELLGHQRPETTAGYAAYDRAEAAAAVAALPLPGGVP